MKKKSKGKVIGIVIGIIVLFCIIGALASGGSDSSESSNIALVKDGYFGEFEDATVDEILDYNLGVSGFANEWSDGEIGDRPAVAFYAYEEDTDPESGIVLIFQIYDDETFKLVSYSEYGDEDFERTEIADNINWWYMNWYVANKIGIDASEEETITGMQTLIAEQFDVISGSACLYGASKDYTGDRGAIGSVIDGSEALDMSVTELINYYGDNILDVYSTETLEDIYSDESTEMTDVIDAMETDDTTPSSVSIYGYYEYDTADYYGNGDAFAADIGFTSDVDGGDYINLYAYISEVEYPEFWGTLTHIDGNTYLADDGQGVSLLLLFDDTGFILTVDSTNDESYYSFEGYYSIKERLNLDEVS